MGPMKLGEQPLNHFHVCAFWRSAPEELRPLDAFQLDGIRDGEQALRIVRHDDVDAERQRLAASGLDVEALERQGALEIREWDTLYLDGARKFDPEYVMGQVQRIVANALAHGFSRVRAVAEMDWVSDHGEFAAGVAEYEAQVDRLLEQERQFGVCMYDIDRIDGVLLLRVLASHPLIFMDGVLFESPLYRPQP